MMIIKFESGSENLKVRAKLASVFRDRLVVHLPEAEGMMSIPLADVIWIAPETPYDVTVN